MPIDARVGGGYLQPNVPTSCVYTTDKVLSVEDCRVSSRLDTIVVDDSLLPWTDAIQEFSAAHGVRVAPGDILLSRGIGDEALAPAPDVEIHSNHALQGVVRFNMKMRDAVGGVVQPRVVAGFDGDGPDDGDGGVSGLTKKSQLSPADRDAFERLVRLFKRTGAAAAAANSRGATGDSGLVDGFLADDGETVDDLRAMMLFAEQALSEETSF